MPEPDLDPSNPFSTESTLPFRLPPFADIRLEHYGPAFAAGMQAQLAEVAAITDNPEPASFDNTLVAIERSGRLLGRVAFAFYNLLSSLGTPELEALEREWAPRMAAHSDAIQLNPALFARIDAVHQSRQEAGLTPEQLQLIERYHTDYVLAGARLDEAGREKLRELNQELSKLSTAFGQNLQAASDASALVVDSRAELDGLTDEQISAAAEAATARGQDGKYVLPLILPCSQPALADLRDRSVRRRLFEASVNRASSGEHDNTAIAVQMAALRAERAALLGFPSHADLSVADQTAGTSAHVDELLARLVPPAVANLRRERDILAAEAAKDDVELAPWDWAFYSERVRAQQFSVDTTALRPYFELDRVLHDGVFYAAGQVYGLSFTPRHDLEGYHPDVRVWEVRNADGSLQGLFLGDFYAREGKRGGAWMSSFVDQAHLDGTVAVVVNNLNVPKPPPGGKALLTFDEVNTFFHEFGHSLHGLFSDVTYPRLSGTNVARDFVEFPSQVNEMWMQWPEILANYAVHVDTGESLPAETVTAIKNAELWGQGFATFEYLAATLLDQAWHRIPAGTDVGDPLTFEQQALRDAGVADDLVPPRYRTANFQHIFAGGYSAGYYSYIWAEVLDADTVEWFKENGGLRRENGDVFRAKLLSRGGAVDALQAFRDVRGRDADIEPLLRRRGLTHPA